MLTNNEKLLIEALETMLDQSWNGPIDCDHFAREKAAAALEFVRQKADPLADVRQKADPLADVRAKAETGDAQAQFILGYAYRFGDDVEKDLVEAVKWYRKAAEQGHAMAQTTLGSAYSYGVWVKKDPTESAKWYRKAAEQEAGVTINK